MNEHVYMHSILRVKVHILNKTILEILCFYMHSSFRNIPVYVLISKLPASGGSVMMQVAWCFILSQLRKQTHFCVILHRFLFLAALHRSLMATLALLHMLSSDGWWQVEACYTDTLGWYSSCKAGRASQTAAKEYFLWRMCFSAVIVYSKRDLILIKVRIKLLFTQRRVNIETCAVRRRHNRCSPVSGVSLLSL